MAKPREGIIHNMRTLKFGHDDKNYLEFKKHDNNIHIEAVDKDGQRSKFLLTEEELEILYRYMIGDDNGSE